MLANRNTDYIYNELITKKNLKPKSLLDICCGDGDFVITAKNRGVKSTGVDINPYLINIANEKNKGINSSASFELSDFLKWKSSNQYDVAVCLFNSFNYFINRLECEQFINNIFKHLKNSGVLILEVLDYKIINEYLERNKRIFFHLNPNTGLSDEEYSLTNGGIYHENYFNEKNDNLITIRKVIENGIVHEFKTIMKVFEIMDIAKILISRGFSILDVYEGIPIMENGYPQPNKIIYAQRL